MWGHKLNIGQQALLNAGLATVYIFFVSLLMTNAETLFGNKPDGFLGPVAFLLLFVLSASVMGTTIFGTPILWYLDGKKKEALQLLSYTITVLFLFTIGIFFILIVR